MQRIFFIKLFTSVFLVLSVLTYSSAQDSDNLTKLRAHSDEFRQEIIQISESIHIAVGRAQRLLAMMGGEDAVLQAAQQALADNEQQWAAELADYVLIANEVANEDNREAMIIKANALRNLGAQQISANARNWYLTSAIALENAAGR